MITGGSRPIYPYSKISSCFRFKKCPTLENTSVENAANVDHVNAVSDVDLVVPIDVEGCTDDCDDFAIKAKEVASNVC